MRNVTVSIPQTGDITHIAKKAVVVVLCTAARGFERVAEELYGLADKVDNLGEKPVIDVEQTKETE